MSHPANDSYLDQINDMLNYIKYEIENTRADMLSAKHLGADSRIELAAIRLERLYQSIERGHYE